MPFTFSHPAIILPFRIFPRKWISMTGLVVGSMVPDFEYFIRMNIQSDYSHTLFGMFYFDLPLGIILTFVFHNVVKKSLIRNSPFKLKEKLIKDIHFNWNNYFKKNILIVILSILIGVFSHLFWDSFTHLTGYFVSRISWLRDSVNILNFQIPKYKVLQHSSTLIGGLIVVLTLFDYKNLINKKTKISTRYWFSVVFITTLVFIIRWLILSNSMFIGTLIVSLISAILISLIVTPLIISNK